MTPARLERWLVPALLLAIAVIQAGLATTRHLTPWKGGGFGMFASLDALGARVLACRAIAEDGRPLRIRALDAIDPSRSDSFRALPHPRQLDYIAGILLEQEYVPTTLRDEIVSDRIKESNPGLPEALPPGFSEIPGFYRPVRASDPKDVRDQAVRLRSVTLEWHRIVYDHDAHTLTTEPLFNLGSGAEPARSTVPSS